MVDIKYKKVKISDLIPADYNPRKDLQPGDIEWEKLNNSISEFGLVEPLVYNQRSGRIVGGHQRAKVLAAQGYTEVDVSVVDLDDTEEMILSALLNKVQGHFDNEKLSDLLLEIKAETGSIEGTGFEDWELDCMTQDYDHIEDLLKDDFSDSGKAQHSTFAMTFTFPMSAKETIDAYLTENGKDALRDIFITHIDGGEKYAD